jgi:hypothetical protein
MPDPIFIETVTFVPHSGSLQPVGGGFFKKLKKMVSIKGIKKMATIKNIVGVVASVAVPGVGGALVNAAITASDVAKGQQQAKKLKKAAKDAAAKDAAAVKQIKDGFKSLKDASDKFRTERGLPPLNVTLPDVTKATPEQIEAAFTTLQNDAQAIADAEAKGQTVSSEGGTTTTSSGTNKTMLYAGAALLGISALYFLTRKRK